MRNLLLILMICFGFGFVNTFSQNPNQEEHRERIKSLKTAFITQELNLDKKTAQQFWPIYNEYDAQMYELRKREHRDLPNLECINESEAEEMLAEFVELEKQDYTLKRQLFNDLKGIISAQDIIKLQKLEDEFHKKLIKEYRARKEKEKQRREEEEE